MLLRPATAHDIDAITTLHVDSWRRNYRGALSDAFLDTAAPANRLQRWTDRLSVPTGVSATTVAVEDGRLVGFVHTVFDDDPVDGSLVDNLHVAHDLKRTGLGTQLMAASARAVLDRTALLGIYLTVLEQNTSAQAFYEARGGECVGSEPWHAPSGDDVTVLRYVWRDPSVLL